MWFLILLPSLAVVPRRTHRCNGWYQKSGLERQEKDHPHRMKLFSLFDYIFNGSLEIVRKNIFFFLDAMFPLILTHYPHCEE